MLCHRREFAQPRAIALAGGRVATSFVKNNDRLQGISANFRQKC